MLHHCDKCHTMSARNPANCGICPVNDEGKPYGIRYSDKFVTVSGMRQKPEEPFTGYDK